MSTNVAKGRFSSRFLALASLALTAAGVMALAAPARADDVKPTSVKTIAIKPGDTETSDAKASDDARQQFVARLFAGPVSKPKHYACFVRSYDADHLARHKLQKVAAMKLLVTAEEPEDKSEGEKYHYGFQLGLKFRNRSAAFESGGSCSNSDFDQDGNPGGPVHFGCGVDCDGGGIAIALKNEDKSAIVSLERVRIWKSGSDADPENSDGLVAGADDKEFRLDRAPLAECAPLISDKKERAAMLRLSRIK